MSGFKGDIQRVLMQKFLCQVLVFAHSARIYLQIHIQKQNTAQTGKLQWCCHMLLWLLQRDQPLHAMSAVQVDEASCILLKTDLFSYQAVSDTFIPRAGPALEGMEDHRGRKNSVSAPGKLKLGQERESPTLGT